jgi:hypothetical protein
VSPVRSWSQADGFSKPDLRNGFDNSNAVISRKAILSGSPPRDGIPSIDQPKFLQARLATLLRPDDLVVSVQAKNQVRACPLRILPWHEIFNDIIGIRV